MTDSVIPESARGGYPWFDRPFDRLTVLSKVEGLTTLSGVEGESRTARGRWMPDHGFAASGMTIIGLFGSLE